MFQRFLFHTDFVSLAGMWCFPSNCPNWCPRHTWWRRTSGGAWASNRVKGGSTTWSTNQVNNTFITPVWHSYYSVIDVDLMWVQPLFFHCLPQSGMLYWHIVALFVLSRATHSTVQTGSSTGMREGYLSCLYVIIVLQALPLSRVHLQMLFLLFKNL